MRFNDIVEVPHMFDATEQVGLGFGCGVIQCNDIVKVANMFDATEQVG